MVRNIILASLGLLAGPTQCAELTDLHLDVVPRTTSETDWVSVVTEITTDFDRPIPNEEMSAGAATVPVTRDESVFSQPSGNMPEDHMLDFWVGNGLFRKLWIAAPSDNLASDGLGPLFNAPSCQRCHINDGRGHPPAGPDDAAVSLFLRVSIPGGTTVPEIEGHLATLPEPTYGSQLQDFGLPGHPPEYRFQVTYKEIPVPLAGGETAYLRRPTYRAVDLGYGPLHEAAMLSPRVTPQMIGLGLLEAIPVHDILAGADPEDLDGDGVSGRANIVWSLEYDQPMLGRFGLKAGIATLRAQTATAFSQDIGVSSPLLPDGWGACTPAQGACRSAPHGDRDQRGFEIGVVGLDLVTFYSRNLGVPARRNVDDPDVLRGKQLFYDIGCTACHTPAFVTHRLADQPEQSFQLIWPYTDMLLHDMGPGLSDHRPESRATGSEWRTPPLWGIGLTQQVSGHTYFLHDGRARSLLEAVLWHGGEAQPHRDAVIEMQPDERAALIRFLQSL